jgi:hypothetical protein
MVIFRRVISVLAVLFFISGCVSHVNELREAQNHFNTAALLENQLKIDPMAIDALAISTQASASYRLSLKILTELIDKKKQELQNDDLLGTAYTLKSLAEWRIGKYDNAVNTLDTVKGNKEIKLFPRDCALVNSLRGFIKNDQAYGHMAAKDYDYARIKDLLKSSIEDINGKVQGGDSLGLYLATVKLVILKNWNDLRGNPETYAIAVPAQFDMREEIKEWCVYAKPSWDLFVKELGNLPNDKATAFESLWSNRLAMPGACQ